MMLKKDLLTGELYGILRVYPTRGCGMYVPVFSWQGFLLLRRDLGHSQEFLRDLTAKGNYIFLQHQGVNLDCFQFVRVVSFFGP